jgi:sodium-dependent dicarboxylate transporter 2/3/5
MQPHRTSSADQSSPSPWSVDRIGLILGPLGMIAWILFVDPSSLAEAYHLELSPEAHRLAGIMILTIIWWVTEPIPIPATGILSVSLAVMLHAVPADANGNVDAARVVLAPFADPSVFFLLGGVFIGRAMTRHGLDRRLALSILCTRWAGQSPFTILIAVGFSVTLVSMWISNTAATAMMYPVTLGIISVLGTGKSRHNSETPASGVPVDGSPDEEVQQVAAIPNNEFARTPYATSLLLITAYASAIGGVATPIGTATNVVAMGYFKKPEFFGSRVDFLAWTAVGVPVMVLLFVGLCLWFRLLTRSGDLKMGPLREYLRAEYQQLGEWKRGEVNTLIVFLTVVVFWVMPGILAIFLPSLRDPFVRRFPEEIVAAMCPVLLFLAPVDWRRRQGTLVASDFMKIDWGTILLFGAGLSLGGLMFKTNLAREVGDALFALLGTRDVWSITALAIAGGILLSEFTSNAATATTLIPVTMTICQQANVDPIPPLIGVTLGASFGSALPVSTPPNAIVYSSGLIPVRRMISAGIGIDILSGIVIWLVLRTAGVFNWSPFP